MALDVFAGAANTGKTGVVYARLRSQFRTGGTAVLLLPTAPDVARDARALAAEVPLGLRIATFDGYLDGLWDAHGDGRRIVERAQRLAVLAETVSTVRLKELADSSQTRGFVSTLARAAERAAESPPLTELDVSPNGAGGEVLAILAAYQDALRNRGWIERGEAQRSLASGAGELNLPDLIVAHRFTGFTPAQEGFLVASAGRVEVMATLPYDEAVPATHAGQALMERLRAAGRVHHQESGETYSSPELVRIERALGGGPAQPVPAAGAVVITEAAGNAAEAALVVREVQEALEMGLAPNRIAVAFRDPAARLLSLREAFEEAGIEAEWDVRVPFGQTGLGRALLLLLDVYGGAGDRAGFMDLLRSPYSPASGDAIDELDARLRQSRVVDLSAVERACRGLGSEVGAFLRRARAACGASGGDAALASWYDLVTTMLGSARGGAPLLDLDGLLDAAAQAVFMTVVAESTDGTTAPLAPARLGTVLRESVVTLGSSDTRDRIQVMGADRLRGRRFECVVLGGLTAHEFPRPMREDPLSERCVIDTLAAAGIDVTPRGTLADERLLFYQVVTRASSRLVLGRRTHDAEGRVLAPSVFLEELLDLYRDPTDGGWLHGEPPRRTLGADGFADEPDAPRTPRRALRAAARCVGEGKPVDSTLAADGRLTHAVHRARSRSGRLGGQIAAELAAREVFAVGEIEVYLQCPFRWYVERTIRPAGLDTEMDAARSGLLAHEMMRRFYEEFLARSGEQRVTPDTLPAALRTLAEVAGECTQRVTAVGLTEKVGVRQVVLGAERLVTADAELLSGMVPAYREWSFGLADDDPPERFDEFALRGRIDRIEVDRTRLVVTDYKLGTVDAGRACAAFEREGLVQLPLYAAVASRRLGLEVAGGLYRSLRSGRARGFIREDCASEQFTKTDVRSQADIAMLIDEALGQARGAVEGIRQGRIAAQPRTRPCPSYCAARAICRSRSASDD